MPKAVWKIQSFHEGLNTSADSKDLSEFQAVTIDNLSVSSVGRALSIGKVNVISGGEHDPDDGAVINHKNGLFTMSSDWRLDGTGGSGNFLINYNDDHTHTNQNTCLNMKDSGGWDKQVVTFGNTEIDPRFFSADGQLRISDASFGDANRWWGYIAKKPFETVGPVNTTSFGWVTSYNNLLAPTDGQAFIADTSVVLPNTHVYYNTSANAIHSSNTISMVVGLQEHRSHNVKYINTYYHNNFDHTRACDLRESSNDDEVPPPLFLDEALSKTGGAAADTCYLSVKPDLNDSIQTYAIMSNYNASGYGSVDGGATTTNTSVGVTYSINATSSLAFGIFIQDGQLEKYHRIQIRLGVYGTILGQNDFVYYNFYPADLKEGVWNVLICGSDNIDDGAEHIGDTMYYWSLRFSRNGITTGANTKPVYVQLPWKQDVVPDGQEGFVKWHYSWLYDESKQESLPYEYKGFNDSRGTDGDHASGVNIVGGKVNFKYHIYINPTNNQGNYGIDKRITGARIYYTIQESLEGHYLVGELDFIKEGWKWLNFETNISYNFSTRPADDDDGNAWTETSVSAKQCLVLNIKPESPNIVDTFTTLNEYQPDADDITAQWKSAVVHGRRVYIGNIKQGGNTYPDRMLKSPVNKFDTFPNQNFVDVAIRDGESIIHLMSYADRVLQFKEKTLYVLNISDGVEFLEDTFRFKGITKPYHAVLTDIGIAWFNSTGVYFYNGKEVQNLFERKAQRVIKIDDWNTFIAENSGVVDDCKIGYVPKDRQLIIANNGSDFFLYDFVTQAWSRGVDKLTVGAGETTNFVLDSSNDLLYISGTDLDTGLDEYRWTSTPSESSSTVLETKTIDFNFPAVRKKIYKIYVTYTGGTNNNIAVQYNADGAGYEAFTGSPLTSSGTQVAELTCSINNAKQIQIKFTGTAASTFQINDIGIVYRLKTVN